MNNATLAEGKTLAQHLASNLPAEVDGRDAILGMRDSGSPNWRQMEWIGFWFEDYARRTLISSAGGGIGPAFGKTSFDYRRDYVWDLKYHPVNGSSGARASRLILNDAEAIERCIDMFGSVGFLIATGRVEFDDDVGTFKAWHDGVKGGKSGYELARIARGARSRKRKVSMTFEGVGVVVLDAPTLGTGIRDRWILPFQEGMRNADGSPRRKKYMLNTSRVPEPIHWLSTMRSSQ